MTQGIGLCDILRSEGGVRMKCVKLADHVLGSLISLFFSKVPKAQIPLTGISKILIIRPGGMGDALYILAWLKYLKRWQPALIFDVLVEKRNAEVFKAQTGCYRHCFKYDDSKDRSELIKLRGYYDLIIDTEQWHLSSLLLARWLNPRYVSAFSTRPIRQRLAHVPISYSMESHELLNFGRLFAVLGCSADSVSNLQGAWTLEQSDRWPIRSNACALALGASIAVRRLSIRQWREIMDNLKGKYSQFVLLGGGDVKGLALELEDGRYPILNLVGQLNLAQTAAVIYRCKYFIGPDSGVMHLADMLDVPLTGIFGPGQIHKWHPTGISSSITSLSLNPDVSCTRFGYTVHRCGGLCISQFDAVKIIEKAATHHGL